MVNILNNLQKQAVYNLNNAVNSTAGEIIPAKNEPMSDPKGRSKRAILRFVGQLPKTIFGTATTDDVHILAIT